MPASQVLACDRRGAQHRLERAANRCRRCPSPKVAERDPDNPQTASANISSLTDVIERRPNDPVAYNQRGIAYAKNGQLQARRSPIFPTRSSSTRNSPAPTPIARWPIARSRRTTSRSPISTRHRRQPQLRRRPISGAATCCARTAISTTRWPTSTRRSASSRRTRSPYHARGLIYQRQGDCVHAITDFNNAIDRNPVRRGAVSGARAMPDRDRQIRRGDRGFQRRAERRQPQRRRLGQSRRRLREAGQPVQGGRVLQSRDGSRPAEFAGPRGVAPARLNLRGVRSQRRPGARLRLTRDSRVGGLFAAWRS